METDWRKEAVWGCFLSYYSKIREVFDCEEDNVEVSEGAYGARVAWKSVVLPAMPLCTKPGHLSPPQLGAV